MSTISSRQEKRHAFLDPIRVLISLTLILAFLVFAPPSGNVYNFISGAFGTPGSLDTGIAAGSNISFASDQQYWDANCSHGWSSDSTCENIFRRAQSCVISLASAYCSKYDTYLQQFRK
jgi:hypothetical protein